MQLKVVQSRGEWYPVEWEASYWDTTIEVSEETAEKYLAVSKSMVEVSDAIEAQVHGTS